MANNSRPPSRNLDALNTAPPPATGCPTPARTPNRQTTTPPPDETVVNRPTVAASAVPGPDLGLDSTVGAPEPPPGPDDISDGVPESHADAVSSSLAGLPTAGQHVGKYQLIRQLGRGGMGVVFLARDTKLARRVAIKFMLTHRTHRTERFLAEARTTARCRHDNIVVIHDLGEHDGYPFMVLEYLRGQTLRQFTGRTAVPAQRAVELMLPVVRALEKAHAHGIVHRDLKPENIFVTEVGAIKVLDFGVAKLAAVSQRNDDSGASPSPDPSILVAGAGDQATGHTTGLIGTPPYMSPEQLRCKGIDHRSDLWAVGVMLYELILGRHPLAPLDAGKLLALEDGDLTMPSAGEHAPGPPAAIIDRCLCSEKNERMASASALLEALEPLAGGSRTRTMTGDRSPFTGLAAFQESEADRFFGRSQEIASVAALLHKQPLVAVVGPSGSGKSSLVRAGVIPALKRSGEGWSSLVTRPGRHPLTALATMLGEFSLESSSARPVVQEGSEAPGGGTSDLPGGSAGGTGGDLSPERLMREPGVVGRALRAWARRERRKLIVFVDQFEELYTLSADLNERIAFVNSLAGAADDSSSPVRVVLSVRSDFLDRVVEDHTFTAEVTRGLVLLPPIARDGLRDALTGPVEAAGHRFENDELVDAMLDALATTRGALPLLQFTATKLWEARDRERQLLTRASYDAIGGVAGTLASHADTVMAGMSQSRRAVARAVFQRLVTPERTRAIASLDELRDLPGDPDELAQVVHHLADARLLAIETGDERDCSVELIHESLITGWPALTRWLNEDQEDAEFLARLRDAAQQWERGGRDDGMLWRGGSARAAEHWKERYRGELPGRERDYLDAVIALSARAGRVKRMAVAAVIVVLTGLVIAASVALIWIANAEQEARRAEQEAKRSEALAKSNARQARDAVRVAAAKGFVERDPTTAFLLLREVEARDPINDVLGWWVTLQGISTQWFTEQRLHGHGDMVRSATFSPGGSAVVTASGDKTARVWTRSQDGQWTSQPLEGHEGPVWSAGFSPDGKTVVTASWDKTARVWTRSQDGQWTSQPLEGHEGRVWSAGFSPDGSAVITASDDATARVCTRSQNGQWTSQPLEGHEGPVLSAGFSPDGSAVVTASRDKTARVWTRSQNGQWTSQPLEGHEGPLWSAGFSPDGKAVVTASDDATARVWTRSQNGQWTSQLLEGHEGSVYSAAFRPDGRAVVTASDDATARVWTRSQNGQWTSQPLEGHEGSVYSAAFHPDGSRVVTASWDKTARVWTRSQDGQWTSQPLEGHEGGVRSAGFSPDGRAVVTVSDDATARVWTRSWDGQWTSQPLDGHKSALTLAGFHPDGNAVVTTSISGEARVWTRNQDGQWTWQPLEGHLSLVYSAGFSPDGSAAVTASWDKTARVWTQSQNGQWTSQPLEGHEGKVYSAGFSPDGRAVVTASDDATARVWTRSWDGHWTSRPLEGHEGKVYSAAFSPDGGRVVTGSWDKTARVWTRSQNGQWTSQPLEGHEGKVRSAEFSPDGRAVVTASGDATARVWPLEKNPDTKDLVPALWRATSDCRSAEERRELLGETPERAHDNETACHKCAAWYRNPDAEFPCPYRAYAE